MHKYDESAAKHTEALGFDIDATTPTYAQLEAENRALRRERDEALARVAKLQSKLLELNPTE